jgi:hypothetical protein
VTVGANTAALKKTLHTARTLMGSRRCFGERNSEAPRASEHLLQAVLSGLERTNVRATRSAANGLTMRRLA